MATPLSPEQMLVEAEKVARDVIGFSETERASTLATMQKENPVLHCLTTTAISRVRNAAKEAAISPSFDSNFGNGGCPPGAQGAQGGPGAQGYGSQGMPGAKAFVDTLDRSVDTDKPIRVVDKECGDGEKGATDCRVYDTESGEVVYDPDSQKRFQNLLDPDDGGPAPGADVEELPARGDGFTERPPDYVGMWWGQTRHGSVELVKVEHREWREGVDTDMVAVPAWPFTYYAMAENALSQTPGRWVAWQPLLPPTPPQTMPVRRYHGRLVRSAEATLGCSVDAGFSAGKHYRIDTFLARYANPLNSLGEPYIKNLVAVLRGIADGACIRPDEFSHAVRDLANSYRALKASVKSHNDEDAFMRELKKVDITVFCVTAGVLDWKDTAR